MNHKASLKLSKSSVVATGRRRSTSVLADDDDPWYCPDCMDRKPSAASKRSGAGERRTSRRRCCECREVRKGISLMKCQGCTSYFHFPGCQDESEESEGHALCSSCRAESEENLDGRSKQDRSGRSIGMNLRIRTAPELSNDDVDDDEDDKTSPRKKRKYMKRAAVGAPKRKKKRMKDTPLDALSGTDSASSLSGPPTTKPAFYFYMVENRGKIERSLARSHRFFNRLPKGPERNALLAKEAAALWVKRLRQEIF